MDDGGGEMDHGREALIGFVAAHGDALELLELAEEILDEMSPLVEVGVDLARVGAAWMLGDDDLGPAFVQFGEDGVAVEGLVADQAAELDPPDQRGDAPTVSNRCPGRRTKRAGLPSASARARILVVIPPLERPMAWPRVPLLRLGRGGGP